ncbi:MAG: RNA polymerase factor sigma-54 [Spirochaetes bacterium]|nr:RNA polymerase factor sigma-54 [Spirochaetota bacterium]
MDISARISLKQTNKLTLTQNLVQSIEMLQLSNVELAEKISLELAENPVLEEDNIAVQQPSNSSDSELFSSVGKELSGDDTSIKGREDWQEESGATTSYDASYDDKKRNFIENAVAQKESLKEHLITQASLIAKDQSELFLLTSIITSLDDNGFLASGIEEIAKESNVNIDEIRNAVKIINDLDPIGCGAANISETLLIQAEKLYPDDEVLLQILKHHFLDLEKLNYGKIASALHITSAEVIRKSKLVHNLDPFPGVKYSLKKIRYIIPDIEVRYIDGEIIVGINDDWIPKIRINNYYKNLLKQKKIDDKIADYVKEKLNSATNLLRSISTRRESIIRVVTAIMEHQIDFLIKGTGHLKPLVYADIAQELGLHESTISRVSNNKFVQTPWGIFEIKYFFVSKLKSDNIEDHSSDEVMSLIKEIIANENPSKPVSDAEILKELQKKDINVARRTIAKYRSILNISSSSVRKKLNLIKNEETK